MSISVLFHGNCQSSHLRYVLNLDTTIFSITNVVCWKTEVNENEFLDYILNSDIIITQPITDNFRDKYYLSSSYIVNNAKKTTKVIIFDSCYFEFYFDDKKHVNQKPCPYHYISMHDCYYQNYSPEKYISDYVNNENLKTVEELEARANNSLIEMCERFHNARNKYNGENVHIISIYDFVKENYKKMPLFYTYNHPSKYLFQYISEQIIDHLQIDNSIDYQSDPLSGLRCIMYKCIQKVVHFDINDYTPFLQNQTDILAITKMYYDVYSENVC